MLRTPERKSATAVPRGATRFGHPLRLDGHQRSVCALAVSPDSKRIASASKDGTIVQWCVQAAKGRRVNTLHGHSGTVRRVEYSADGTKLLSGSTDRTVRIWEASHGTQLHVFEQRTMVWCVRWLPSLPGHFAVADADSMHLCDATTSSTVGVFDTEKRIVFTFCFSPDGARLVAGMAGGIRVFEVASGRCVARGLRVWLRNARCCACMHAGCRGDGGQVRTCLNVA